MNNLSELPIDEAFLSQYYFVKEGDIYTNRQYGHVMTFDSATGLLTNFKGDALKPENQLQFHLFYQRLWDECCPTSLTIKTAINEKNTNPLYKGL